MSDLTDNYTYMYIYAWTTLGSGSAIDLQKMPNHLFSSFCSWRVCKQAKFSHLGCRKPARIHWTAEAPKIFWCGFWFRGIIGPFSKTSNNRPLQSMATVIGTCWTYFCLQKLKRRILVTFGFNRTALSATQPNLHSMFCALFLKIALLVAELMSFGHPGAAVWHRWTIIYGVQSKISVTPASRRQLMI